MSLAEDKEWYRAKVLAYSSEDRVCVGYLDFGNSEEVDLGHLRPITPSLLSLPIQAMICSLAGNISALKCLKMVRASVFSCYFVVSRVVRETTQKAPLLYALRLPSINIH